MKPSIILVRLSLLALGAATTVHVCCGCASANDDGNTGATRARPLNTLRAAQDIVRDRDRAERLSSSATVFVEGTCAPPRRFTAADGGSGPEAVVTYRSYPGAPPGIISGGVPLPASALSPVTDPAIVAQINATALPFLRQLSLATLGITNYGTPSCHAYMGGEASILPGNLVSAGLELFLFGDPTVAGDLSPLTLARYPNRDHVPKQWAGGKVKNMTILADAATIPRLGSWAAQLSNDPSSMYVHYLGGEGWDDHHNAVASIATTMGNATVTLADCASAYAEPSDDGLDDKGTFYVYNVLAELDEEGEYYVNRSSGMLYVWLPSADSAYWYTSPWGKPVVSSMLPPPFIEQERRKQVAQIARAATDAPIGELSVSSTLLQLDGTAFLTIDGLVLTTARNAGILAVNTSSITVSNCVLENFGNMAVNVTGGDALVLTSSVVRHAGNGAVFFYAGDRTTLTNAGHTVRNCTVSYSNRYMYCYVPMVALADCGNAIVDSELFGGPHQGTFISGNEHLISGCLLHDLVEAASDSGVVYMGRDFTYQGNVISSNTFLRINTADPGDDVSAVYLDDLVSGFTIVNNVFVNVSRALLLGGGRDITFTNNTITGVNGGDAAVHFDNRGMGWASDSCTPPNGELIKFLARVPYKSAAWIARYPALANILQDEPCIPKRNVIVGNGYCGLGSLNFIDESNATITSWGSTAWGNVEAC
jgi:hypothetical protein